MAIDELLERYGVFYTDFVFKRLFAKEGNEELLISFLNALLDGEETIQTIKYIPSEQLGYINRSYMFNAYCETDKGEGIIVEIQKAEQQFYINRSELYSSFFTLKQPRQYNWRRHLKSIYAIGILNFNFDDSDPRCFHHEILRNLDNDEIRRSCIFLETPKFTKTVDELENMFEKWLFAIRHLPDLLERPSNLSEAVFVRFFEQAEIAKFNRKERLEYEGSLKAYRDWYSIMKTAKEKSRAEGLAEGRVAEKLENARGMKVNGISADIIHRITGLSIEEIEQL